jgi:subtilisin family serine protease
VLGGGSQVALAVPGPGAGTGAQIDPGVAARLAAADPTPIDVVVALGARADLGSIRWSTRQERLSRIEQALRANAASSQRGVLGLLRARQAQHKVTSIVPLWVANEIEVTATPSVILELAARPEVREIRPEVTVQAPPPLKGTRVPGHGPGRTAGAAPATTGAGSLATAAVTAATAEPGVARVNAPALWDLGVRGQGVVVASLDTGVDATHPDLAGRWRGGTSSWFDPNGEHPSTPTDVNGHGTQTMGVMVGGDAGGTSIGMAPDAPWIAAKIFNDRGSATTTAIHRAFQWLLDPDANPATADAPNVVNSSWTMSSALCSQTFAPDLAALRTAGILPVFAAGNYGPGAGTVMSPANLPQALAIGGTDGSDVIDPYSSRGPSSCGQPVSPTLAAPDANVRTSDLYGGYFVASGTSLAAPHVSGALALLLSAFPGTSADRQQSALAGGALDLGATGPDTSYGYGRLDARASYQWLQASPDVTVSVSPGSASTTPGGVVGYTVTAVPVNGFASDLTLSLAGLSSAQAGWTFDPAVIPGGSGTAQLTISTAATIAAGSYPLTISASDGTVTRTASATLAVTAPPDFTLGASPTSATVNAGSSANVTVSVGSMNGFGGTVVLSASGLPGNVGTATVTPTSITGTGTAQLALTTVTGAPAGTYPVTVTGTSGSLTHTATVSLTVVNAPPDFTLGASPTSATVNAGNSATVTLSVGAVNGFAGTVALSASGLPGNVGTATVTPSSITGAGTAQLRLATATGAPGGTYTVTVTATSGSLTHSATVSLTVVARDFALSATPASVTVSRGGTATYTVSTSALGGFTGNVSLSRSGGPSNATTTWSVNPVTVPGTSTLRVRTSTFTARGTYQLRITGTSGSLSHQVTVTLVVQ